MWSSAVYALAVTAKVIRKYCGWEFGIYLKLFTIRCWEINVICSVNQFSSVYANVMARNPLFVSVGYKLTV